MRFLKHYIALVGSLITAGTTTAQQAQQAAKYAPPVDFRITLAGNVGEIRANHFHTGIDIKAAAGIGSPVLAVADGHISRIGVSPSGYGNVLYMTHADGTVSVYGHLDSFAPRIRQWVRKQQYAKKSFRVDLYPTADMFVFRAGERIASLGNSGSSGGPHLHFEIRDAQSGSPVNLISRGIYKVADRIPPQLYKIHYIEADTVRGIPLFRRRQTITITAPATDTPILSDSVIYVGGRGYLAYEVIDYKDGRTNTMGIYSIEQKVGGRTNFSFTLDRISFDNTRYINTFTDYALNRKSPYNILRAYVSPNNTLGVYGGVTGRGIISAPPPGELTEVTTTLTDDAANMTTVRFYIAAGEKSDSIPAPENEAKPVVWNRDFSHSDPTVIVTIPQRALYESALINIEGKDTSGTVAVGDADIPLQKAVAIKIKGEVPQGLRSKALIVSVSTTGKLSSQGGKWDTDGVKTEIRTFGRFRIAYDTVAPTVTPLPIGNGSNLRFKISDDLSGISSYSVSVDGSWELAQYDEKIATITTAIVRKNPATKHSVEVTVTDGKTNVRKFKKEYTW